MPNPLPQNSIFTHPCLNFDLPVEERARLFWKDLKDQLQNVSQPTERLDLQLNYFDTFIQNHLLKLNPTSAIVGCWFRIFKFDNPKTFNQLNEISEIAIPNYCLATSFKNPNGKLEHSLKSLLVDCFGWGNGKIAEQRVIQLKQIAQDLTEQPLELFLEKYFTPKPDAFNYDNSELENIYLGIRTFHSMVQLEEVKHLEDLALIHLFKEFGTLGNQHQAQKMLWLRFSSFIESHFEVTVENWPWTMNNEEWMEIKNIPRNSNPSLFNTFQNAVMANQSKKSLEDVIPKIAVQNKHTPRI